MNSVHHTLPTLQCKEVSGCAEAHTCPVTLFVPYYYISDNSSHPTKLGAREPLNHRESVGYVDMAATVKGGASSGDSYLSMSALGPLGPNAGSQQPAGGNYVDQV